MEDVRWAGFFVFFPSRTYEHSSRMKTAHLAPCHSLRSCHSYDGWGWVWGEWHIHTRGLRSVFYGSCRLILLAIPTSPSHAVHSPYTPIHIIPRPVSITTTHSLRSVVMMEWRVGMWMVRRVVRDGVAKRPVCRERTGVPSLVSHALCLSPSWRRNETRE